MKKHLPYQIIVSLLTAVILVMAMTLPAFPGGVVYADETPAAASGGDGVTYEGEGGEAAETEDEDDQSGQQEASVTKDTGASSDDAGAFEGRKVLSVLFTEPGDGGLLGADYRDRPEQRGIYQRI